MTIRRAFAETEHRQKRATRSRRRRTLTGLVAVGLTLLTVVAVGMDRLLRPGAFPIKELRLEGEFDQLEPEHVRSAVIEMLGDNYFSLDLGQIEQAVEGLPWVYKATVKRSWPHGLTVRVEEQQPVARWGDFDWLNDNGEIIPLDRSIDNVDLVQLSGPDSTAGQAWENHKEWSQLLAFVNLRIEAISVDDRYAWTVQVRSNDSGNVFEVLLGQDDHDRRMRRFVGSYPALMQESTVMARADLRYPNGLAVARHPVTQEEVALNEVDQ